MLTAGFAEVIITPPIGEKMSAFPAKRDRSPRRAEGVRDPLRIRTLALSDGERVFCLCAGDLVTWTADQVERVRQKVSRLRPEMLPASIQFSATHSHSSLENTYLFEGHQDDPVVTALIDLAADSIIAAVEDLQGATLSLGTAEAPFNFNRRARDESGKVPLALQYQPGRTEGPTDPLLTVISFDQEKRSLLWVHWTAHSLTLGPPNRQFSADYPGALCAAIEGQRPDVRALFTNGAAGNIHPQKCMRADDAALNWLTEALRDRALAASDAAEPMEVSSIDSESRSLSFPNRADATLQVDAEVSCLRFCRQNGKQPDTVIGFMPGEPYVEFQLGFREAMQPVSSILVGYANGWVGYVPTLDAYGEGGYGVDFHATDPPLHSRTMLPPGAGEEMLEALIALGRS